MHQNDAVSAEIARMLNTEGPYTVEGVYIPCADRAARQRRLVAERNVATAQRRAAWLAAHPVCEWCSMRLPAAMARVEIGGRLVGACCRDEMEAELFGARLAPADAMAPLDESDVAVCERESGIATAFDFGVTAGESIGEQRRAA